jgi:hypothetical protein
MDDAILDRLVIYQLVGSQVLIRIALNFILLFKNMGGRILAMKY